MSIPGIKKNVYRWVLYKQNDGRLVARTPKPSTHVGDLANLNIEDYGAERILPAGSKRIRIIS